MSFGQERYQPGDIVENFTLVNRANGEEVSLHDFEGKVVFLEWFAYWCPFCQAAAADVKSGIVDFYSNRNGNANGVPVMHVGLNLQANAESFTQDFVNTYRMELVLNDFDRDVASRFQPANQPIFAIINGVANSPSHAQWELLYTHLGYGDLSQPLEDFREAIESVEAGLPIGPPSIAIHPMDTKAPSGSSARFEVQADGEQLTYQWFKGGEPLPDRNHATLELDNVTSADAGTYSVSVSNPGGKITSETATLAVVPSIEDFLADAGLSGNDLAWEADPDADGFDNVFEFLAQTNPTDPRSRPEFWARPSSTENISTLEVRFDVHPNGLGPALRIELSPAPDFDPIIHSESRGTPGPISFQLAFPEGAESLFTRLVAYSDQ